MLQLLIKKNTQKMCQEARKILPPGSQRTRQVRRRRRWPRGRGMCSTFSPDSSGEPWIKPHFPLFMTLAFCGMFDERILWLLLLWSSSTLSPWSNRSLWPRTRTRCFGSEISKRRIVMEWQVWSYQIAKGSKKPIEGKAEPEGELCIAICRATCLPAKPPNLRTFARYVGSCWLSV